MREYTIARVTGKPDFSAIEPLQIDTLLWSPEVPITASAKLCYDDAGIHVQLSAQEPNIRAEERGPLGFPCQDSCLEFFFCPMEGDDRYFNIESNPNGAMFLGFGPNVHELCRLIQEEPVIAPKAEYTEDGWKVSYSIPHSFVRRFFPDYAPAPGKSIRANCYKCCELKEPVHYLCWCPIVLQYCSFHNPSKFGTMYFGE